MRRRLLLGAALAAPFAARAETYPSKPIRVILPGPAGGIIDVAPGPVWTPLIPSTMPPDQVREFGQSYPMGRPAQPKELAPAYVMLATDEASYVSGATIAVTGGKPIL